MRAVAAFLLCLRTGLGEPRPLAHVLKVGAVKRSLGRLIGEKGNCFTDTYEKICFGVGGKDDDSQSSEEHGFMRITPVE